MSQRHLLLVIAGVAGAVGFAALHWALLDVVNGLGHVSLLRQAVTLHASDLWIWSVPYPKPYDVPVYLLAAVVAVAAVVMVSARLARPGTVPWMPSRGTAGGLWAALGFLSVLLLLYLGPYPDDMRAAAYWTADTLTPGRYAAVVAAAAIMVLMPYGVILLVRRLAPGRDGAWIRHLTLWTILLIAAYLAVYEPRYPLQILHDGGYLGPIHQVLHGETIYKTVASQYLFMGVYPLALLRKLGVLMADYHNLTLVLTALWMIQLGLVFAIVRRASRSDYWGIMCVTSVISICILGPWLSPVGIPNTGPLRWLGFYLTLFLITYLGHRNRATIVLLVLMVFTAVDTGLEATVAYALYRAIALVFERRGWGRAIVDAMLYSGVTALMLGLVQLFTLKTSGSPLRLSEVLYAYDRYARLGADMVPMPFQTFLYLLVAVNLVAVAFAAVALQRDASHQGRTRDTAHAHVLLFAACLALVANVYYAGRSTDGNLFNVAQFTLIPLFLLLPMGYRSMMASHGTPRLPTLTAHLVMAALLIGLPLVNGRIYVGEKLAHKVQAGVPGLVTVTDVLSPYIDADVALIRRAFPDGAPILWLGDDTGTFVLARTGHASLLYFTPHRWALTTEDLRVGFDRLVAKGTVPDKIVVECTDAVRYALAREAGVRFATYDRPGRVQPTAAHGVRRADFDRFRKEAKQQCHGAVPPRYNAFLPNDLYADKWNPLVNFADFAGVAFGVTYAVDIARDCTAHNCVLRRVGALTPEARR